MKRHYIVASIAGIFVIAIFIISWIVFPEWQNLGLGGILTLLAAILTGVAVFLQNVVSIWKDLQENPKSSEAKLVESVTTQKGEHIFNAPGGTINFYSPVPKQPEGQLAENAQSQELIAHISENKDKEDIPIETLQPIISAKNLEMVPTFDHPSYWNQHDASYIFQARLAAAFPGTRRVLTFHGIEAVDRLEILLSDPLYMKLPDGNGEFDPFWWFRGYASSEITRFVRLAPDRFLLGEQEMKIDFIKPVRSFADDERNFVYVQILAEEPTGVYQYSEGWLEEYLREQLNENIGYYYFEAYGIWNDKLITVEELQDGGTIVNGKPTRITDAEYRERFITKFNFIICGQNHVINNSQGDKNAEILLNDILLGRKDVSDFVRYVKMLPRLPFGYFHYG